MTEQNTSDRELISPEQKRYAAVLWYGCWIGIGVMVLTYFLYVSGIMTPYVPIAKIPELWHLSAPELCHRLDIPVGWGWVGLLGYGDMLNYVGLVIMAVLTIVGFASVLVLSYTKKDVPFTIIAVLEVLILVLAASGIFGG